MTISLNRLIMYQDLSICLLDKTTIPIHPFLEKTKITKSKYRPIQQNLFLFEQCNTYQLSNQLRKPLMKENGQNENTQMNKSGELNDQSQGSSIIDLSKSLTVDWKKTGKMKVRDIIQQNSNLKNKIQLLEEQIRKLKTIIQGYQKPSIPQPLIFGGLPDQKSNSSVRIENMSDISSYTNSPFLNNLKTCSEKSKANQEQSIKIFSNSNVTISVGNSESHPGSPKQQQNEDKQVFSETDSAFLQKKQHFDTQQKEVKRQPYNSEMQKIDLLVSNATNLLEYDMNNQFESIIEDDGRDSFLEESSIYENVFLSNRSQLKNSINPLKKSSLKKADPKKKLTQTYNLKVEQIHEEDQEADEEQKDDRKINSSLNLNQKGKKQFSISGIEEESEQTSKNDEDLLITKSLASGNFNLPKKKSKNKRNQSSQNRRTQTLISDRSTYQNSDSQGNQNLRCSSMTEKRIEKNERNRGQKIGKQIRKSQLYEIKESYNQEHRQAEEVMQQLMRSKSSTTLHAPFTSQQRQKYENFIKKLLVKLKGMTNKNRELKDMVHLLRHQFRGFQRQFSHQAFKVKEGQCSFDNCKLYKLSDPVDRSIKTHINRCNSNSHIKP